MPNQRRSDAQILLQIILEKSSRECRCSLPRCCRRSIRFYGKRDAGNHGARTWRRTSGLHRYPAQASGAEPRLLRYQQIGPEPDGSSSNMQAPMIQSMMTNYIEQSKNLFVQMQENMQTRRLRCSRPSRSLPPGPDRKKSGSG